MSRFRLKRPRATYANVAASLALFFALAGGTALAAHHFHYLITSTHQIKPSVVRSLRGHNGHNGRNGRNGAAGAPGAKGATGATGPTGASGFTSTLPSGKTEVGTWAGNVGAATSSPYDVPVSFNIPLATKPAVNVIAPGAASTAACPGSVTNPQASSGNLCIYEAHVDAGLSSVTAQATSATGLVSSTTADVFGTVIVLTTSTTGSADGTWAVSG